MFKTGNSSQHRSNHSGYHCQNCHLSHGSNGTSGTNRGRMVVNWINVRTLPYSGKSSCGTSPTNTSFRCH